MIVCDKEKTILKNGAIVFDSIICDIGDSAVMIEKYPNAHVQVLPQNSVIMPGLINPHIHFEFSKNKSTLQYGSFLGWLYSVIDKREELINELQEGDIDLILQYLLRSGTTTLGAVSSYGFDLPALAKAQQMVVFFPEVLGSRPDMIDALYTDFLNRFGEAQKYQNEHFKVGIAIHSPYSTHPVLINKVLQLAYKYDTVVQAHFMESPAEREWLYHNKGEFKDFFANFLNQTTALTKPIEFLAQFKNIKSMSFTHCVEANNEELLMMKTLNASIIHCPVSNRLLNNSKLHLTKNLNIALATDGLSSNTSLSLWDELKAALMVHTEKNLNALSTDLLYYATAGSARVLDVPKGALVIGLDADFLVLELPSYVEIEHVATQVILHTHKPQEVYIKGVKI